MKALIFSDSHGNSAAMELAIQKNPDADYFFFLGDGMRDAEALAQKYPRLAFVAVPGNMDFGYIESFSGIMEEVTLDIDGVRIVLTHGHLRNVRAGLENIAYLAEEKQAQIVLYGHTHIPYRKYLVSIEKGEEKDEIILFNPGSIGKTYGEAAPSFGILEVQDGKISIYHGKVVL